jgi:hypothetical protein
MQWQSFRALIFAFSLVKFEFSESACFCVGSMDRRTTRIRSNDDVSLDVFAPERPSPTESSRRQRRNKYQDFSKVSDHDPLEVLISESKRKNDEIITEVAASARSIRNSVATEVSAIQYVQYPDVKGIDVSFRENFVLLLKAALV